MKVSIDDRGCESIDIANIPRFIDWVLELPEDLKWEFRDELELYEQKNQMHSATSIEQMAEARGVERQQRTIALNLLHKNIPLDTIAEATGLTIEQLQQLQ